MKIFIGLGNPGEKYQNNRHNVGYMFINYLKTQNSKLKTDNLKFTTTSCFMNESGKEVKKIIENWKLEIGNLYIVHDDLDIPLGKFKIQLGQGPKLHNGIKSIEEKLGSKNFWRIRIGVDARKKENWINGETYVLQDFLPEEKEILLSQVFPKILERIKSLK